MSETVLAAGGRMVNQTDKTPDLKEQMERRGRESIVIKLDIVEQL